MVSAVPALTVRALERGLEPLWRSYVASREDALFYASLEFRDLLLATLESARPYYLVALQGDQVRGVLPCFLSSTHEGRTVLNSLPYYGSNGGVLSDSEPDVERKLLEAYLELESAAGCAASTLISSPFDGERALYETNIGHAYRDERIGQLTPLPEGSAPLEERLFASYDETARRNVRKARKSGITFRRTNDAGALDFLYRTHQANIGAIGGLPKERVFFDAIPKTVPAKMWSIYVAERGGEPIAALLIFRFSRTVEYYTPAVVEKFRPLQALPMLVHEAMMEASRDGMRWWNWGGTWKTQEGVYRFKKKWGAREMSYYYYTRVRDESLLDASRDDLLADFPGFYVLPFSALRSRQQTQTESTS